MFVDFGDGEDFSSWVPVCIGVSRLLTECAVFYVVVPCFGKDTFRSCIHLS